MPQISVEIDSHWKTFGDNAQRECHRRWPSRRRTRSGRCRHNDLFGSSGAGSTGFGAYVKLANYRRSKWRVARHVGLQDFIQDRSIRLDNLEFDELVPAAIDRIDRGVALFTGLQIHQHRSVGFVEVPAPSDSGYARCNIAFELEL